VIKFGLSAFVKQAPPPFIMITINQHNMECRETPLPCGLEHEVRPFLAIYDE